MTKSGWAFLMIWEGRGNPWLYRSSQYLVILLNSAAIATMMSWFLGCAQSRFVQLERGWSYHEGWGLLEVMNLLLPWLWGTIKGTAVSAPASELGSRWGEGGGGSWFGPGHSPSRAEQAHLCTGTGVGREHDSSHVDVVTCEILVHFISLIFEQLYWGVIYIP